MARGFFKGRLYSKPELTYAMALHRAVVAHGFTEDPQAASDRCNAFLAEHYPDRLKSAQCHLSGRFALPLNELVCIWVRSVRYPATP